MRLPRFHGEPGADERAEFFEQAAGYTEYVSAHLGEARLLVKTEDRHVGRSVFMKQGRGDMKVLNRCIHVLSALAPEGTLEGRTFVDVGANIGSTTVPALLFHGFGDAVAIEPEPENFTTLRLNLVLNGIDDRARALQAAVSNTVGELDLVVDRSRSGKHWIASNTTSRKRPKSDQVTIKVPTVTLDSLAEEKVYDLDSVSLVWIDAEHHEGAILEGATELLRRGVPIVFEWDPRGLDRRGDRATIQELMGEHYTHFLDIRAAHDPSLPRYQLRAAAELVDYEHPSDADEPSHFTEVLVFRLTAQQEARFSGSIRILLSGDSGPARQPAKAWTSAKGRQKALKLARKRWKHTKPHIRRLLNRRFRPTYRSSAARVPAREELPVLLNARKLLGSAAVVGDGTGRFSEQVLTRWRGERLVSVGMWTGQAEESLARFGARSECWRLSPLEAAERVPDSSLDFVYVDPVGLSEFDRTVEAWLPKLRPGGIMAGYAYVDSAEHDLTIKSSVDSLFGARSMPIHRTDGPSAVETYPSWVVEIPI